jgi:N-acetylglutamate synthase-like GNAT family acetyltransferase
MTGSVTDQTQAEVAFVVADAYQHHHIATELLHRLAHIARMAGMSEFKAEVLAENATMPSVFREAGFPLSSTCQWGTIEMTMGIASGPKMP